ncbi:MAG TPA: DegT/DnrJ/EryC1/StrS family aminotransferase [Candidatus Dormibacteraeota bacterium]|nr:DegT/DnrJ/EryC1/StrS family aminotransferase [Candidatus Dormibacteraeota bacterium]
MKIPLSAPDVNEEDIRAVSDVLRTSRLSLGPKLEEFEHAIAAYVGASDAVAVNSGTSALHLCLRALGVGEGDEVIVPSFAFIAVANAVRHERATPVFVDIESDMLNLDTSRIESAITHRTKAIIVVHTFGCPANLEAILAIAGRHALRIIEDASEAIGAEYKGRRVGVFGDAGIFSFYPNKQITTGEGGIVVTQNPEISRFVRKIRNQGRGDPGSWFQHSELGFNYRISDINCALGIEQLKRIESILMRREAIALQYSHILGRRSEFKLPLLKVPFGRISWFVYVIRLGMQFTRLDRDWIVREMHLRGIGVGRYFAPIHLQPIYKHWATLGTLRVTEEIAPRTIALPFFNRIQSDQIEEVCSTLTKLSDFASNMEKKNVSRHKLRMQSAGG